jgi:GTPase SAR1 family protein
MALAHWDVAIQDRGEDILLQVWDTPGYEEYAVFSRSLLREADCCVICYDTSRPLALPGPTEQIDEFISRYKEAGPRDGFVFVSGTKCDLATDDETTEVVCALQAKQTDIWIGTHLTSAKTGEGVKELFLGIAQALLVRSQQRIVPAAPTENAEKTGCC